MPLNVVSTDIGKIKGQRVSFKIADRKTGFSNFVFLLDFLLQQGVGDIYHPALVRVFSLARKLGFEGLLIDRIPCTESSFLMEENQALSDLNCGYVRSDVFKFSFFKTADEDKITPHDFLGYAVLKIDRDSSGNVITSHVFESVLWPPRKSFQNNFLHCKRRYSVTNSLGSDFIVEGALYAQQNAKTFVCAHVALRTVLACHVPEGDVSYSKIVQFSGNRGALEPNDIESVISGLGLTFEKTLHEPPCNPTQKDYMRELYGFTESAAPALLGFELSRSSNCSVNERHIVPVLGHTFNEDSWVPPSTQNYFTKNFRYFSSEQWLSSHLMHDDNFGPYYCLPRHFLQKENFRILYGINSNRAALFSVDAEAMALVFFIAQLN